ncbi:MAG: hypothetical protein RIC30_21695 [Marinoscillum sp.]|uniref:Cbp1 family collagen-binding glycoprotein adhesin n=1 Tax=Marinoscillum sp. TaxID=2024838 RepID=UPI0032F5214C
MNPQTKKSTLKISAILLVGALAFTSCDKEERKQLQAQADELEQKLHERDSAFNSIINVMAEVETQIEQIKTQENLIASSSSGDFSSMEKDQMVGDLKKINELISSTNEKVKSLSSQLEDSNIELNAFKRRVQDMMKNLKAREASIAQLKEDIQMKDNRIAELDTEVGSLVTRVQLQTETIELQNQELVERENDLNTAFFAVDTEKKLKDEGLVTKEGGFLWIGKTTELQADAAQQKFTEVDIQNTKRFYIDSEKLEIVTEHPSESYKLVNEDGRVKYLEVVNPSEFWKISKYLVVSVKG